MQPSKVEGIVLRVQNRKGQQEREKRQHESAPSTATANFGMKPTGGAGSGPRPHSRDPHRMATCGIAAGAQETRAAFRGGPGPARVEARIHTVGAAGNCYAEPVVIIDHPESGFPPFFTRKSIAGKARMLPKLFLKEGDPRLEHILGAPWPMR